MSEIDKKNKIKSRACAIMSRKWSVRRKTFIVSINDENDFQNLLDIKTSKKINMNHGLLNSTIIFE